MNGNLAALMGCPNLVLAHPFLNLSALIFLSFTEMCQAVRPSIAITRSPPKKAPGVSGVAIGRTIRANN